MFISYQQCLDKVKCLLPSADSATLTNRIQRLGFEDTISCKPLAVDGKLGPKTLNGRFVDPDLFHATPNLYVAFQELLKGSQEVGGSNMGPFVRTYFRLKSDPTKNAGPFCAGGASYCLDQGFPQDDTPYIVGAIRLGKAVAAQGQMKRQLKKSEMKPGDLDIWERKTDTPGTGHVATHIALLEDGSILSIDFNVGGYPAPTRCFISNPDGSRGDDKFLFGARW